MVITIIIWAAIIQGFLLGLIFVFHNKRRSFSNQLLGFFLFAFAFEALTDILPLNQIGSYSITGYFTLPEVKLLFPLLFVHFVLLKVGKSSSYRLFLKIHYWLACGIIAITLVNLMLYLSLGSSIVDKLGWGLVEKFYMSFQYYSFMLTIIAFVIALRETWSYRNMVRDELTDLTMMELNWLWQYIFAIAPIILFWGAELIRIALGGRGQSELTIIGFLFIALFNYFVSYKAYTHHTLFDAPDDSLNTASPKILISASTATSVDIQICEQIKSMMEVRKFYLDPNLTIHLFSKEIDVSARTISTCVNNSFGLNFNEWVNNYRVDTASELLKDRTKDYLSIEGIGSSSGFKSRSAMYAAFKRKTGLNPGNFRGFLS